MRMSDWSSDVCSSDLAELRADTVAAAVRKSEGVEIDYIVGTMIELPRACLRAAEIAEGAEFFSFGTTDPTQTCFRSEERRVGKECDSTCRSRCTSYPSKKPQREHQQSNTQHVT